MNKAKILIVEDEAIIAMEIESQLQSLGYENTSIVDTGDKTISKTKADKPDIILMDIRIKGEMDGIETAEVIRNQFGIPVIFSTTYLDEKRIERAKITMPFGYVLKPIQERDLKVTLDMALYVSKVDKERRKAEEDLRNSENKMRSIFRVAPTGIGMVKNRVLHEVNSHFCEMTGYSEKELIGKSSRIVYPSQEEFEFVGSEKYKQIAEGGTGTVETRMQNKKGSILEVLLASTPLDINDQSKGVTFTATDITERKQAEKELKQSEERFRALFENIQEGFSLHELVYDVAKKPIDYRFLEINSSFERFTGQKKEDIIGKRVTEVFPGIENDPADWIGTYAKVVINNEPISFEQFSEFFNKWYSCRAFKIEKNCFAVSFTDITDRKLAES